MKTKLDETQNCALLDGLGKASSIAENSIEKTKELIRTVFYSGRLTETYVETRMRMYKNLKVKSSSSIPPDPHSVEKVIKNVTYQVFQWLHSTEKDKLSVSIKEHGWRWNEEANLSVLVWFKEIQL